MTANPPTNLNMTIKALLAELEVSIADYPEDLRKDYSASKVEFNLDEDEFGDEDAQIRNARRRNVCCPSVRGVSFSDFGGRNC